MPMETPDLKAKLESLKQQVAAAPELSADQIKAVLVDVLSYQIDLAENLSEAEDFIGDDVPCVHVPVDLFSSIAKDLEQFFANGPRARSWFVSWLIENGCSEEVAVNMFDQLYQVMGISILYNSHLGVQAFMEGVTVEEYTAKMEAIRQQAQQQFQQQQIPPPGGTQQ